MTTQFVAIGNAISEWLKSPVKTVVVICAFCGLALFVPQSWLIRTPLVEFTTKYQMWLWVVLVISGLWVLYTIVEKAAKSIGSYFSKGRVERAVKCASPEQAKALLRFVHSGSSFETFVHSDGALLELERIGVVVQVSHVTGTDGLYGNFLDNWTYRLTHEGNAAIRKPHIEALLRKRCG